MAKWHTFENEGADMNDTTWKQTIYEPYLETWKIIKLIQYADQTPEQEEQWNRYVKEIDRLDKTYPNNPFAQNLIRLLLDAGDSIAKMNNEVSA